MASPRSWDSGHAKRAGQSAPVTGTSERASLVALLRSYTHESAPFASFMLRRLGVYPDGQDRSSIYAPGSRSSERPVSKEVNGNVKNVHSDRLDSGARRSGVIALPFGLTGESSSEAAPPSTYVSVGDSLAYGEGASDLDRGAFASRVHRSLQLGNSAAAPGDFLNFGLPGGETSTSMLSGQLQTALSEIGARKDTPLRVDDVAVITVSIGGNDFFGLVGVCQSAILPIDPASPCAQALVQTFSDFGPNLAPILGELKGVAGPEVKVAILTYDTLCRRAVWRL